MDGIRLPLLVSPFLGYKDLLVQLLLSAGNKLFKAIVMDFLTQLLVINLHGLSSMA